jgi:hypothetical protein
MFASNSRYASAGTYQVTLADGSVVTVTCIPIRTPVPPRGWYCRPADERLDVVAYQFVMDATMTWALCDTNDAMSPDALATHELIGIPRPAR